MKRILTWSLALIAACMAAFPLWGFQAAATATEEELRWDSGRRLTWADFKGTPDRSSPMDALTESGISFTWRCDSRGFQMDIYSMFIPAKSWVKEPTSTLLAHEQLHFDITELHARKLRKYLTELRNPCYMGRDAINQSAKRIIQSSNEMQHQYDDETRHSERTSEQKRWEALVARELEAHAQWAE